MIDSQGSILILENLLFFHCYIHYIFQVEGTERFEIILSKAIQNLEEDQELYLCRILISNPNHNLTSISRDNNHK